MTWHGQMYWSDRVYYDDAQIGQVYVLQCVINSSLHGSEGGWIIGTLEKKWTSKFLFFTLYHVRMRDVDDGDVMDFTLRWFGDHVLLRYQGDETHPNGLGLPADGGGANSEW